MKYVTLSNFIQNVNPIIDDILNNETSVTVKTKEGNVVVTSEHQYDCLLESLCRSKHLNN